MNFDGREFWKKKKTPPQKPKGDEIRENMNEVQEVGTRLGNTLFVL